MKAIALFALMAGSIFIALSAAADDNPDDGAVSLCEQFVLSSISTPATYARVDLRISDSRYPKPGVILEFDAQNEFGALVRSKALCVFAADDSVGGFRMTEIAFSGSVPGSRRLDLSGSSLTVNRDQTKMTHAPQPTQ
ncbi:hypothetical protein ACUSIJ_25110 [Pseudochelatococcus sp. B33]